MADYLPLVKGNQPTLHDDIRLLSDPPDLALLPLLDRRDVRTINQRHGRWDEERHLVGHAAFTWN